MNPEAKEFIKSYSQLSEDIFHFNNSRKLTKKERRNIRRNGIKFLKLIGVSLKRNKA